jgi:imidazolonepropionase-like amidohydrolase
MPPTVSRFVAAFLIFILWVFPSAAQPQATRSNGVLFENVMVFDGKSARLSKPTNVLVKGNTIETISTKAIESGTPGLTRIKGGGRTLMPGLIDAHWHTILVRPRHSEIMELDAGYLNIVAADEAKDTLMRGFTTVRDMGGPSFGLQRAIDEGVVIGPRIYPSGAMITITGGHGDFRHTFELPRVIGGPLSRMEELGGSIVADSPDEVRLRAREQLMLGATQIKLTAGGGVASPHSPLDVLTFTEAELRAAVEAASNRGTYVAVHAYTPASIQRAIAAGVKCIEHGQLMDEESAKLMAKRDTWLSIQPFTEEVAKVFPPESKEHAKALEVVAGTERAIKLAKKYDIKTAFGTDVLFSQALAQLQGAMLTSMARWYSPGEVLAMATGTNAELLALSGKRNPYPGKLGVIEVGALADLLLVDGNPVEHIELVADARKNIVVIMKDGKIYKNTIGK